MEYSFAKYQASGNDFIIIDDGASTFPSSCKKTISLLCNRKYGIGADGLILFYRKDGLFEMLFFNPDGSRAAMCGNGIRSLVHFLHKRGIERKEYPIVSYGKTYTCRYIDGKISVDMGEVKFIAPPLVLDNKQGDAHLVDSGVPHLVVRVDDVDGVDVQNVGKRLRNHPSLLPEGANVNFMCLAADGVRLRTYERGVEAETLSCGTGAVAAAFVAKKIYNASSPIDIIPASAEKIVINFSSVHKKENVEMVGSAACTFTGKVVVDQEKL